MRLRAILREMPQPSITRVGLKITYLKFHSNTLGVNELTCTVTVDLFLPFSQR